MENLTNFQKIISKLVIKEGSQELLAKKLNVTPSYVSMFETGKRGLSKPVAKALEEQYGYNADELLKIQSMEKIGMAIKKPDIKNVIEKLPNVLSEPKTEYRREVISKSLVRAQVGPLSRKSLPQRFPSFIFTQLFWRKMLIVTSKVTLTWPQLKKSVKRQKLNFETVVPVRKYFFLRKITNHSGLLRTCRKTGL